MLSCPVVAHMCGPLPRTPPATGGGVSVCMCVCGHKAKAQIITVTRRGKAANAAKINNKINMKR